MALSIPTIFEDIAKAKSITERKKILLEHGSNPLKELLKYAFHPDIKFLLPEGVPPYKTVGSPDEYNPTYLYPNIRKLYLFVEGGNDGLTTLRREQLFVQLLEELHPKEAEVLIQVKDKKLKYRGLTYKLVKETFPDLIP
tara:strand:+ start:1856 stop:2275 length:420 start_codon:yes stop_codon:yes gene_type:complete